MIVQSSDRATVETQVLATVRTIVAELAGGAAIRDPTLADVLDRDLGISSLERVELLLRLERAFGVRLPDAVMAEAQTVTDLVSALLLGSPPSVAAAPAPASIPRRRHGRPRIGPHARRGAALARRADAGSRAYPSPP